MKLSALRLGDCCCALETILPGSDDGAQTNLPVASYLIELDDGKKIYFAGDTCVFGDMQLIGRIYSPDVAVLPIGGHFTMDPREAAVFRPQTPVDEFVLKYQKPL